MKPKHNGVVVTWQAPNGETLNVCDYCEDVYKRLGTWPKNRCGEEYCSASHGRHRGECDVHWESDDP